MALSVASGHYFYWNGTTTLFPWAFFLAVDFFFILSGFVLTKSIFEDRTKSTDTFIYEFLVRRALRLFPLYLLLMVPGVALQLLQYGQAIDPAFYFAASALLLQGMGFDAGAQHLFADTTIGIAWSISVELWVGLLWFPLVHRFRERTAVLAALSVAVSTIALLLIVNFSPNTLNVNLQRFAVVITFGSLRAVLGFGLGTLCFLFFRSMAGLPRATWRMTLLEASAVTALLCLYLHNSYDHRNEFIAPWLFCLLILAAAMGGGALHRALNWKAWEMVRPLSYAIYLIHPFFIFVWRSAHLPFNHRLLPAYLLMVVVTAAVCYRFVERPWIRRGHRFAAQAPRT